MRYLLDTHIALWTLNDDRRLGQARALLANPQNRFWVSIASLFEIALKRAVRQQKPEAMPVSAREAQRLFLTCGFTLLPISAEHVCAVEGLALHHKDPFDRLLVAQAKAEPMHLVTHDARLKAYGPLVMLV